MICYVLAGLHLLGVLAIQHFIMTRKARILLGTYYAFMLEYRGELFLWAVVMCLPLLLMGLWTQAAEGGSFSLSAVEFARYFIAVFVIRQLTVVWVIHEFGWYVTSGRLSPWLLQPLDPGWRWVCAHLSEKVARLPLAMLLVVLALCVFPQALWGSEATPGVWWPHWSHVAWAVVMVELAWAIRFLMQYTLAMLAFWQERVDSVDFVIYLPYLFLSGMVAPLTEFPEAVRALVMWTPFPYLVYVPAMLLTDGDRFTQIELVQSLGIMLLWLVGLWLLNRIAWRAGLKHYSAMGA